MYKPSSKIIVDPEAQGQIMYVLGRMPRDQYLANNLSEIQEFHWYEQRVFYRDLYYFFERYFQGESLSCSLLQKSDKKFLEVLEAECHYYLFLYQMVYQCWEHIEPYLSQERDIPSPGYAVALSIGTTSHYRFVECLHYSTFSPTAVSKLLRKQKKIDELVLSKQELNQPFTRAEENMLAQHIKDVRKTFRFDQQFSDFDDFLQAICGIVACRYPSLQKYIDDFLMHISLRSKVAAKGLSKIRGYEFDGKGNKRFSSSAGGVYE